MASSPTQLDYRPADTTLVTSAAYDLLGNFPECQVGNGTNVPTGSSNFGFEDMTYTVTTAQILAGVQTQAY